jgi:CelD/BcsL family acetyltransferase involved in cellulose biosynthesis
MELIRIEDLRDFSRLKGEWNNLLSSSGNDTLFLSHEWLSSWWESYGRDDRLMVLLLRRDGSLVGAAPLMIVKCKVRGFPVNKVAFIGDPAWTLGDFIIREDGGKEISRLMEYILSIPCDIADFRNIPVGSKNITVIEKFLEAMNTKYLIHETSSAPLLRTGATWEDFYSRRSGKFKKTLRNKLNRINKFGKVEVQRFSTREEIKNIMPVVFGIGLKSWKNRITNAISSNEQNRSFYSKIAYIMADSGRISIWLLNLNGNSIAFEYHINYRDKTYALLADYDEDYKLLSPGSVLEFYIMRHFIENGASEYDLGCGANFYKMGWTDTVRRHVGFLIYKDTLYSRMFMLAETRILPGLKAIRDTVRSI